MITLRPFRYASVARRRRGCDGLAVREEGAFRLEFFDAYLEDAVKNVIQLERAMHLSRSF
jgi:hypothetical protein